MRRLRLADRVRAGPRAGRADRAGEPDDAPPAPRLAGRGGAGGAVWSGAIEALGYRLVPFDPAALAAADDRTGRALLRALGIAGFAAGNVMLLSIGDLGRARCEDMGPATRALLHWVIALLALPAIV